MKFTEEQYQQIVEAWEHRMFYKDRTQAVVDVMCDEKMVQSMAEGLALANPATREWAYEQYVEKEKRYVWHSKKNNVNGKPVRLFKDLAQTIRTMIVNFTDEVTLDEHLTETEIREWGYDPERFDKEEVE